MSKLDRLVKFAEDHGFQAYHDSTLCYIAIPWTGQGGVEGVRWEFAETFREASIILGY